MNAVHCPELVGRVATWGATFGPPQIAVKPEVLRTNPTPSPDSRGIQFQRENYKKVAPAPDYWPKIWGKVVSNQWGGFSNEELASIKAPILIAVGDHDFVRLEHALETFKLIPNAELAVIPDAGHFALFSEQKRVIPVVENFLEKPEKKIPFATAGTAITPMKPDKNPKEKNMSVAAFPSLSVAFSFGQPSSLVPTLQRRHQ
jgi:hypothetical protein